jgi:hypothetical protein
MSHGSAGSIRGVATAAQDPFAVFAMASGHAVGNIGPPVAPASCMSRRVIRFKYGYIWITLALFVFSVVGHWLFAWFDYVDEQRAHQQPIEVASYVTKTLEATFENWQSEFLQLLWQVGGLIFLFAVGSPQSKEGDDRKEEKLDWIMRRLDREAGTARIAELDEKYVRR